LIQEGVIKPSQLVTIRKREIAWHPKEQQVISLPVELIKIKAIAGEKQCIFYDSRLNSCMIYQHRPVSCQAFRCWDTKDAEDMFLKNTLSRQDIFARSQSIIELIEAYEGHFDLERIFQIIHAGQDAGSIIEADIKFRVKFSAMLGISEDELLLFLGRPVKVILEAVYG